MLKRVYQCLLENSTDCLERIVDRHIAANIFPVLIDNMVREIRTYGASDAWRATSLSFNLSRPPAALQRRPSSHPGPGTPTPVSTGHLKQRPVTLERTVFSIELTPPQDDTQQHATSSSANLSVGQPPTLLDANASFAHSAPIVDDWQTDFRQDAIFYLILRAATFLASEEKETAIQSCITEGRRRSAFFRYFGSEETIFTLFSRNITERVHTLLHNAFRFAGMIEEKRKRLRTDAGENVR